MTAAGLSYPVDLPPIRAPFCGELEWSGECVAVRFHGHWAARELTVALAICALCAFGAFVGVLLGSAMAKYVLACALLGGVAAGASLFILSWQMSLAIFASTDDEASFSFQSFIGRDEDVLVQPADWRSACRLVVEQMEQKRILRAPWRGWRCAICVGNKVRFTLVASEDANEVARVVHRLHPSVVATQRELPIEIAEALKRL